MRLEDGAPPAVGAFSQRVALLLATLAGSSWLPFAIGLAGLGASVVMWRSILTLEREEIAVLADSQARSAATDLLRSMQDYNRILGGIAQRPVSYLRQKRQIELVGLKATLWAEASGKVGWVTPLEGNEDLAGADLSASDPARAALLTAGSRGQPASSRSEVLTDGDSRFYLVVPVSEAGRLAGFLVGVFTERVLYPAILRDAAPGWAIAVLEDDREVFRRGFPVEGRWLAESKATLLGTERRVRLGPTPDLSSRLHSRLPAAVLVAGCAIALLFAASVGLAQSARRRAREAEVAQAALRESEAQYRLLFEGNPQPMWVYDPGSLRFLAVNAAAVDHYGYSRQEFLGMTLADIRPAEDVGALVESVQRSPDGAQRSGLWRHRKKDGTLMDVEILSHPVQFGGAVGRLVLAHDVTEKRRLEEQLRHSQKLDAVGQLAGGVAHDFNNILGVITGYSELLRRETAPNDPRHRRIEQIGRAAERAASLTRQLLAFSRKQVLQSKVIDLNSVVGEMDKMLQRLIGEDLHLVTVLAQRLGKVKADPGQIEQILMNLAVNARDAMPRGGRLTIETANVEIDAVYLGSHAGVEPGSYVMLAVSDTGQGMEPEVLAHIFEPFFTTKEAGKGTGLGLATVHGIVKQSGGHIFVYSEPAHGTVFKIYLPRLKDGAPDAKPAAAEGELPRGSETVLLVEDEASLRSLLRECLEACGYQVVEALHPADALDIVDKNGAPFQLLITDVVMPGMSGRELAGRLASSRPEMRVLYVSGYTDDAIVRHGVLSEDAAFLQKPFSGDALARKVREVLDGAEGRSSLTPATAP